MQVRITNDKQRESVRFDKSIRLGRNPVAGGAALGRIDDGRISRDQLHITIIDATTVGVSNLSASVNVHVEVPAGDPIPPRSGDVKTERALAIPVRIRVGHTLLEIDTESRDDTERGWGTLVTRGSTDLAAPAELDRGNFTQVVGWLDRVLTVLHAASGTGTFYQEAAQAIVESIGLDCGLVLLRENDSWREVARHSADATVAAQTSQSVLNQILLARQTIFLQDAELQDRQSLRAVSGFVACPLLDQSGKSVLGVLYGFRFGTKRIAPVEKHEAQMAQALAGIVALGIARRTSEDQATRRQIQFEQFVSPEVVRELDDNPQALSGKDTIVTTLFVDLRNYSKLSERLATEKLFQVVRSVMNRLAGEVRKFHGTTCGFAGDGLMAMWNAPLEQSDHAVLACRAALAMMDDMPELNHEWREAIGVDLAIGIGINSGPARVGNTGCDFKPQYGPQGDSVNLASRVEGATKKMGVPVLITGATRRLIPESFGTRRLCSVRVVGRETPVQLHQLHSEHPDESWQQNGVAFEQALAQFESGNWSDAAQSVFPLISSDGDAQDAPSLILMSRAIECLRNQPQDFDPVWNFFTK